MTYATNPIDGTRIWYEDDGGSGAPVLLYGGILDSTDLVRLSPVAQSLAEHDGEFRLVYVDHRGLGRSDRPRDPAAYDMRLRAADAGAVLDALALERAHVVGSSYGGRLAFGIGEHAPDLILSVVAGGHQPYAVDPKGPLAKAVLAVEDRVAREGAGVLVETLEEFSGTRFPEPQRSGYLRQDGAAVAAATRAMLSEGDVVSDPRSWRAPCLIYLGAEDADFVDQARRAAREIPGAELVTLEGLDHVGAHTFAERVVPAVLRTLRRAPLGP